LHSDGEVKVNQEGRRGKVIVVLVDHEIVNGDISVEEACHVQGFMSFDAALQGGKQNRSGAGLVDRLSIFVRNDTPLYLIEQHIAANLDRR
jgi:hypothetical protein